MAAGFVVGKVGVGLGSWEGRFHARFAGERNLSRRFCGLVSVGCLVPISKRVVVLVAAEFVFGEGGVGLGSWEGRFDV